MQAGAMKCPIVCSDAPGNIDLVTSGETGVLYKSKDAKDLELKLDEVLKNEELLKIYSDNLYDVLIKYYPQDLVHQKMLQRYNELLSIEKELQTNG